MKLRDMPDDAPEQDYQQPDDHSAEVKPHRQVDRLRLRDKGPHEQIIVEPARRQDDRVSDYAVVWTINEKGADGKTTEFLNNGKMVVDTTVTAAMMDDNKTTIKKYNWPTTRKWDYVAPLLANGDKDGCYQDIVYLRLADTYLLYAEALLKNNQAGEAIKWINKVRNRSNAVSITEAELTAGGVDFILDERSRELLSEEER